DAPDLARLGSNRQASYHGHPLSLHNYPLFRNQLALLGRRFMLVDVDTKSESILADGLAERGNTPLIARTASKGGFHSYYGHNEGAWRHYGTKRRAIRPELNSPIDYLGTGFAVVPPSLTPKGHEFIRGNLDDLNRLPPFQGIVPPKQLDIAPTAEI